MEDKAIELYHILKSCKEGSCGSCERNPGGTNTYWCRKQLLQDYFDWFNEYFEG